MNKDLSQETRDHLASLICAWDGLPKNDELMIKTGDLLSLIDKELEKPSPAPIGYITHESLRRLKKGGNCKGSVPIHLNRSNVAVIPIYTDNV